MGRRATFAEFEPACRAAGISMTLQRRAVLEVLLARADHPTADQVVEDLAERGVSGVSRATVFRALELFAERGIVARVCHPGSAARYEVRTHRHHHLVCDVCGKIADFDDDTLNALKLPELGTGGFRARDFSVHVRGLCAACAREEDHELRNEET
ncbi:MAG: Fur family transcriptional regulator [Planctomycetota bacterium JB042]